MPALMLRSCCAHSLNPLNTCVCLKHLPSHDAGGVGSSRLRSLSYVGDNQNQWCRSVESNDAFLREQDYNWLLLGWHLQAISYCSRRVWYQLQKRPGSAASQGSGCLHAQPGSLCWRSHQHQQLDLLGLEPLFKRHWGSGCKQLAGRPVEQG